MVENVLLLTKKDFQVHHVQCNGYVNWIIILLHMYCAHNAYTNTLTSDYPSPLMCRIHSPLS